MGLKNYLKSGLLLAVLGVLSITQSNAQTWTAPTYNGSVPVSGTTYYIYNVGSKGFLNRGGYWATQAVVSATSTANAAPATIIKWTATNTSGSTWTFQYNNGSNVSNNYLFPASTTDGSVYTDNTTSNSWDVALTDATKNIYSIQIASTYGGYVASQYLGTSTTTESTNKGIANVVRYNRTSADSYVQWKFVSQEDADLYNARVLLDRYMTYAKLRGGIDISSYVATYNAGVTADINTAATNLLTVLGRTEVTSSVANPSFESTTALESWTNTGSFARQSNTPGQGWTKDGTYYCEKYIASGSNLATGALTQTVSGLANGLYGITVSGHAIQQAGANPLHTGAFITAGTSSAEMGSGNDYNCDYAYVTNGTLSIGYALQGTVACNWTGFDNFRLYYYGAVVTPILTASVASLNYDDIYKTPSSFNVAAANLSAPITITAPAGINVSPTSLPANTTSASISVTYDGTSTVNGNITVVSGTNVVTIPVKASSNASCYTPAYSTGNLIADPTFSAASLSEGGFGGWGPTGIDQKKPYCGRGSAYIFGSCWPNGGSIDRALTTANGNALKPNTTYRLRAMINSQATTGTSFQFQIEGYDGSTSKFFQISKTNGWEQFDQTFTTGTTVTEHGIYFNSCTTPPAITDTCFIDNYELFEVPITTELTATQANNQKVYVDGTKLVTEFALAKESDVTIAVYDVQGKLMVNYTNWFSAGSNKKVIDATLPTGIYIVKINSDEFSVSKKVIK
jgi:hypothetical protein